MQARRPVSKIALWSILVLSSVSLGGCDSSGDSSGTPDVPNSQDLITLDTAGDSSSEMGTFHGKLIDFQTHEAVVGATLTVLDNADGKRVVAQLTSSEGGLVEFNVAKGLQLGFKALKDGYIPTYQFNIASDYGTVAAPETLWIISQTTWDIAPGMAGLTLQAGQGNVAGALYYRDAAREEVAIGCATVQSEPATPDIRYFGNSGLPTTLDIQPSTNPKNGYFFGGNVPARQDGEPTETIISGWVGTTRVGSVRIFTYPDSACISNIYYGQEWNPETQQLEGADTTNCPAGAVCDPNGECP